MSALPRKSLVVTIMAIGIASTGVPSADTKKPSAISPLPHELTYDFGHMGIDFVVQHTYYLVNRSQVPIRILDAVPSCQCTSVLPLDSLVAPGDSARFRVKFNSKDFYGPVVKTFRVTTDHPELQEIVYSFTSIVGQWFDGLKPEPVSLFFLPVHKSRKVTIPNTQYGEIRLSGLGQSDNTYEVNKLTERAGKGQQIELEIVPKPDLKAGTYQSSLTLTIDKKDHEKPTILTLPVKIVRY